MEWTALQIEKALGALEDALPRLVAEHEDPRAFAAAVRRAATEVERHAGDFAPYVSRRIDAMLVALVRSGDGHHAHGAPPRGAGRAAAQGREDGLPQPPAAGRAGPRAQPAP